MKTGAPMPADLARELLSFGQSPGKYSLRLGEPRLLFSRLDTVAQWAAGRLPADLSTQAPQLTAAAVLFIQRACFAQGNTHYQILGLTASTLTPELLRTRYRSLIRLTHPDMGIAGLPPDAAGMVNRALDVLSDDFARQRYDDQLKKSEAPRPPPMGSPAQAAGPGPNPHMGAGPGWTPSGYARPRRRVPMAPVPHKQGLSERLLGLLSQYPRQVHWALVAGVILVPVGLVLFWAAQDTTKGGVLVASKRPPPVSSNAAQGKPPDAARAPLQNATLQQKPAAIAQNSDNPPAIKPQQAQGNQPAATALASHTPASTNKLQANASPANAPTIHIAGAAPTQQSSPYSPPPAYTEPPARTEQPNAADGATQLAASQPPAPLPTPAPERAPTQAFTSSVPAGSAPYLKQVVAAAPPPATASATPRTLAPVPQPVAAPTPPPAASLAPPPPASVQATQVPPANSVDVTEAKRYLADIVGTLESAPRARHLQDYLSGMKVRGTLLRPALEFIGSHPGLSVHRSAWAEQRQPGLLSLRSTIVLRPASAGNEARLYNLHAEFQGTEQGTVLVRLELTP